MRRRLCASSTAHPAVRLTITPKAGFHAGPWNAANDTRRRGDPVPAVQSLLLTPQTPPPVATPEQTANFFLASYDPFVFGYAMFDLPTILEQARRMDKRSLLDAPLKLLVSPYALFRHSTKRWSFGEERLALLMEVLESLLCEHDASSRSLASAAQQLQPHCPLLVSLLRGVCLCTETAHPFASQATYVLEELTLTGVVSLHLCIDGNYEERRRSLGQLLLSAAREFGSAVVLCTALELLSQQVNASPSYAVSKVMCHATAREDKRLLDWSLKARGALRYRLTPRHGWTHSKA